jgi:serine/threonine protein kinase
MRTQIINPKTKVASDNFRGLQGLEKLMFSLQLQFRRYRRFPKMKAWWGALQLDPERVIKWGSRLRVTEAKTAEFIAQNTTIPVPKVLDVFTFKGTPYLVSEYVEGSILDDVWGKLSSEEKTSCMEQLRGYLKQLREIPCPEPEKVQSVDGTGCWDDRLHTGEYGPFATHAEFNKSLAHNYVQDHPDQHPDAPELFAKTKGKTWRTVFSHGDLGPHNIMWKDGKIVAIIDWENAGWFPEYWEYTRTYFGCRRTDWWEAFQGITETYPDELAIEEMMATYFIRI